MANSVFDHVRRLIADDDLWGAFIYIETHQEVFHVYLGSDGINSILLQKSRLVQFNRENSLFLMPNDTFEVARNKIKLKLLKQFDEGENYRKQNVQGIDHIFWDEVKRKIEKKNVSAEEKVKEIKRYLENRDYLLHLEEAKSAILDAFREWRDQIERRPTVSEYRQLITVFNGIWQLTVDDRGAREYRKVKELFHIQLEQENKKKGNQFFQILILSVIISTVNWLISSWACIFVDSYQVLVSVISHFSTRAIQQTISQPSKSE
ncbi:MAG: hypothetical protein AAFW00_23370, partial [Bacteroidota bacterium]